MTALFYIRKRHYVPRVSLACLIAVAVAITYLAMLPIVATPPVDNITPMPNSAYTSHATIDINGEASLDSFSPKTGSGTQDDPYVISDLEIDGTGEGNCIFLLHIASRWLVIRNCWLRGSTRGVWLLNASHVTIEMCNISARVTGVHIASNSTETNVTGSRIVPDASYAPPWRGIYGDKSNYTAITNNTISIQLVPNSWCIDLTRCNGTTIRNNTLIDDAGFAYNSLVSCATQHGMIMSDNTFTFKYQPTAMGSGFSGQDVNDSVISSNRFGNESYGGRLFAISLSGDNATITGNTFTGRYFAGINIFGESGDSTSQLITISGNNLSISPSMYFIDIGNGDLALVENNVVHYTDPGTGPVTGGNGISLSLLVTNSTIRGNVIDKCGIGIHVMDTGSVNNTFYNNSVNYCSGTGIQVGSGNNTFYNNTIAGNQVEAQVTVTSNNTWDNGSAGNMWGDYLVHNPGATQTNGIYDSPYVIDDRNIDHYPVAPPNTDPVVEASPNPLVYSYGVAGQAVTWTVYDTTIGTGRNYKLYVNAALNLTGVWNSSLPLATPATPLAIGNWTFKMDIEDGLGGTANLSVAVRVQNVRPSVFASDDIEILLNEEATIGWTFYDFSVDADATYAIYKNGTRVKQGTWKSGDNVTYDIFFSPGIYNVTLVADDGYGGVTYSTVIVTVRGNLAYLPYVFVLVIVIAGGGVVAIVAVLRLRKRCPAEPDHFYCPNRPKKQPKSGQ